MELKFLLQNFLHLFFPRLCMACDTHLMASEEVICATCKFHLPLTDFHLDPSNETARYLWGKIPLNTPSRCYIWPNPLAWNHYCIAWNIRISPKSVIF